MVRVLARFIAAEEESPKGNGPPARWHEWLDAVHDGGKRKVRNPNPSTAKKYPEVSFSTALKDKQFFQKALEEYHRWADKSPDKEDKAEAPKGDNAEAPKKDESKAPSPGGGMFKADKARIEKYLTPQWKQTFDSLKSKMERRLSDHESVRKHKSDWAKTEYESLSKNERLVLAGGEEIGQRFVAELKAKNKKLYDVHQEYAEAWQESSSKGVSAHVHGALKALGVEGYATERDKASEKQKGETNQDLQEYLQEAHAFTQAYYQHLGVKEVTLYRGVLGQGVDNLKTGDEVQIQTRELSSFTMDPRVAVEYGTPVKFKVPVEHLLWSPLTEPKLGRGMGSREESEVAVMAASKLVGVRAGDAGDDLLDVEQR